MESVSLPSFFPNSKLGQLCAMGYGAFRSEVYFGQLDRGFQGTRIFTCWSLDACARNKDVAYTFDW